MYKNHWLKSPQKILPKHEILTPVKIAPFDVSARYKQFEKECEVEDVKEKEEKAAAGEEEGTGRTKKMNGALEAGKKEAGGKKKTEGGKEDKRKGKQQWWNRHLRRGHSPAPPPAADKAPPPAADKAPPPAADKAPPPAADKAPPPPSPQSAKSAKRDIGKEQETAQEANAAKQEMNPAKQEVDPAKLEVKGEEIRNTRSQSPEAPSQQSTSPLRKNEGPSTSTPPPYIKTSSPAPPELTGSGGGGRGWREGSGGRIHSGTGTLEDIDKGARALSEERFPLELGYEEVWLNSEQQTDCLDPIKHQGVSVLFSNTCHDRQKHQLRPCLPPW